MYESEINEIVAKIESKLVDTKYQIPSSDYMDIIKSGIQEFFKDKVAFVWTASDVIDCAKRMVLADLKDDTLDEEDIVIEFSEDDAMSILQNVHDDHDANYGVTWDTLEQAIIFHFNSSEKIPYTIQKNETGSKE